MICPKCQNAMKTVDKNGIHIDQCQGCRGIFLDRGELEAIAGAESSYYGGNQPPPPYQGGGHAPAPHYGRPDSPRPHRGGYADSPKGYRGGGYADSPKGHRGGYGHSDSPHAYGHKRRKGGFLEGLFD